MAPSPAISFTPAYSSLPRPRILRCLTTSSAATTTHHQRKQEERNFSSHSLLEKPWIHSDVVRMPTAPWMREPLVLPASDVLDLSRNRNSSKKKADREDREDSSLTGRVKGGRSRHAMRRIIENVAKLQELDAPDERIEDEEPELVISVPSVEEVDAEKAKGRKVPWTVAERAVVFRRTKKEKVATLAEMTLSEEVVLRLMSDARKIKVWIKAKRAGVTQDVVDEIRKTWRKSELAMVNFVEPLSRNMDRAREIVETKTGGLVVLRRNESLVVYRGQDYVSSHNTICNSMLSNREAKSPSEGFNLGETTTLSATDINQETNVYLPQMGSPQFSQTSSMFVEVNKDAKSITGTLYEREANRLLDGLGPRFIDWWWPKPLPVDADLLQEVIPDFKQPVRRCPHDVRPKLTDDELTYLRKLARPLPTHFALGKNTKLQGLAAAIIKLWEKSLLAKIAIKRGIPNTNNELMSCELKHLTGGILVLRNKFFIIIYRGKDFLPKGVAETVVEREMQLGILQLHEEQAREKVVESLHASGGIQCSTGSVGTFMEFQDIQTYRNLLGKQDAEAMIKVIAEKENVEKELRKQEHQLSMLKLKLESSEKELARLNAICNPSVQSVDQELFTEEERQAFRKIGLKMDEVLLLGRRGIYDGVIGNIHLHWKHRELVKVVTMQNSYPHIMRSARFLEIESGGILVAVEKLRTGYAIIIYRGKNYRPPANIFSNNLPTKREALQRSIEVQRRGSLKFFAHQRENSILDLKRKLRNIEERAALISRESHDKI